MKQKQKTYKVYLLLIAVALLFLLCLNSTYAYFSATKKHSLATKFATMSVTWHGSSKGKLDTNEDGIFIVTPSVENISRGGSFNFIYEGAEQNIGLAIANSPSVFARVWVNAYDKNSTEQTPTNYGQYFKINFIDDCCPENGYQAMCNGNRIYYIKYRIGEADGGRQQNYSLDFASGMTLSKDAPFEILEKNIVITLHFEAIQAENKAYLSWDDDKGYATGWEYQ